MTTELSVLMLTALSIGFIHVLLGPDHYLPFIVLSRAEKWSTLKTMVITFLCGLGHVLSSVLLGMAGIALGVALTKLEGIESTRGEWAGWILLAFGLVYFIWGIRQALKSRTPAYDSGKTINMTPWILFLIFVLGPCEPLIPLLIYPAAKGSLMGAVLVAIIFSITTIVTMMGTVLLASWGVSFLPFGKLEKYAHAMAGAVIFLSGIAVKFLGL